MMDASASNYHDAEFLIFNTGRWWNPNKVKNGVNYFQEGNVLHSKMEVGEAYEKAINTWARWVDENVNRNKTQVLFVGYSASHFGEKQWNSGGACDKEKEPIVDDKLLTPYPWLMRTFEHVISNMKTPILYMNLSKMTDYRKDAHPSIYRGSRTKRKNGIIVQDCMHWCLPGVPDSWNQLVYASLLLSSNVSSGHQ
ncbi:hypothetical protein BVRB_3g069740 isoform B [Beta vulgaris subsp. vulgaris]|nr:hypothetical protein BVRB_3g069740 isoform B [Beta vulgaris subsp. vulgaris]